MTTREKSEIQKELTEARRHFNNWNAVHFEGQSDPDSCQLNPHFKTIEALAEELYELEQAEMKALLSGDSLQKEREWFNSQGFTSPAQADKACEARGYNMSDLFAAIKACK